MTICNNSEPGLKSFPEISRSGMWEKLGQGSESYQQPYLFYISFISQPTTSHGISTISRHARTSHLFSKVGMPSHCASLSPSYTLFDIYVVIKNVSIEFEITYSNKAIKKLQDFRKLFPFFWSSLLLLISQQLRMYKTIKKKHGSSGNAGNFFEWKAFNALKNKGGKKAKYKALTECHRTGREGWGDHFSRLKQAVPFYFWKAY